VRGRVAHFSCAGEVDEGAFLRDGTIVLRWDGHETELCALAEVAVAPTHAVNALAAAAAATGAGPRRKQSPPVSARTAASAGASRRSGRPGACASTTTAAP
jgi:hypothetical protein